MTHEPGHTRDIVLVGINATWEHASFGLRCLLAALGDLRERAQLLEFTLKDRVSDVVERVLELDPRIVGISVYIWNARETLELVRQLKVLRPSLVVVVGGPEVSHELDAQEVVARADHVVVGEGEVAFASLCRGILGGPATVPPSAVSQDAATPREARRLPLASARPAVSAEPTERSPAGAAWPKRLDGGRPDLDTLFPHTSPYALYSDEDLRHRVVYVEASRGCPFSCEFCLSSLDEKVRPFPLDVFLGELERLLDRGLLHFKFVDRTFNLKIQDATRILDFFLERLRPGLFLHFEMIPDRLPDALRERLAAFPPGGVQLEVGIQTLDEATSALISRRQHVERIEDNLRWLRQNTGVHLHADLIAGLPGEDAASFARGFDRLYALRPHEIQLGVLKRLRGAPIDRHTRSHGMIYSESPPYEVLQTSAMSFRELQRIKRLARYFDMVHNSGRFPRTLDILTGGVSAYADWLQLSDWLWRVTGSTAGVSLARLTGLLLTYLVDERGLAEADVRTLLEADLGRSRVAGLPRRQALHASAASAVEPTAPSTP